MNTESSGSKRKHDEDNMIQTIKANKTRGSKTEYLQTLMSQLIETLIYQTEQCKLITPFTFNANLSKLENILSAKETMIKMSTRNGALGHSISCLHKYMNDWTTVLSSNIHDIDQYDDEQIALESFLRQNQYLSKLQQAELVHNQYKESMGLTKLFLDNTTPSAQPCEQMDTSNQTTKQRHNIILPKLTLQRFNGDPTQWHTFYENFNITINLNSELSDIEKLTYLTSLLDGDAKRMVCNYSLITTNYEIVKNLLKTRFGNNQIIAQHLLKKLNQTQPLGPTIAQVKTFIIDMDQYRQQLTQNGETIGDSQFRYLVESKLPRYIIDKLTDRKTNIQKWDADTMTHQLFSIIQNFENQQSQFQLVKQKITATTLTAQSIFPAQRQCLFCTSNNHKTWYCDQYKTTQERQDRLIRLKKCIKCLQQFSNNHRCNNTCTLCKGTHHRLICRSQPITTSNTPQPKQSPQKSKENTNFWKNTQNANFTPISQNRITNMTAFTNEEEVITTLATNDTKFTLPIVQIKVTNQVNNETKQIYALLDSGSEISYITNDLIQELSLHPIGTKSINVEGFNGNITNLTDTEIVEVSINNYHHIQLTATQKIVGTTQIAYFGQNNEIKYKQVTPQILIGTDHLFQLLSFIGKSVGNDMQHFETKLGDIIITQSAKKQISEDDNISKTTNKLVENIWKLENIGINFDHLETNNEEICDQFVKDIQFQNNRYSIKWLWNGKEKELPTNFGIAFYRLKSNLNNLLQNPPLLKMYKQIFEEQIKEDIIEQVTESHTNNLISYVPHQPVYRPDKTTTKLRVVYDCSASTKKDPSINDCLHTGPLLIPQLVGLLLRFRIGQYVVTSDIEKAFLQIQLQETERDVVRFLLPKNWEKPIDHKNIQVYRFKRVIFGAKCSPSILALTIQHHLSKYNYGNEMLKNIYVDNIIESHDDATILLTNTSRTKQIFADANFTLREYYSNNPIIMNKFQNPNTTDSTKILGHKWYFKQDLIELKIPTWKQECLITKRTILGHIGSYYDPLGLISPCVLPLKIFLQQLWSEQTPWDTPLSQEKILIWSKLVQNTITTHSIPRKTALNTGNKKLVIFADASQLGLGIAAYLIQNKSPHLIFAKSKLFPPLNKPNGIKLTIPRKELTALLCAGRIANFLLTEIEGINDIIIYNDSMVALQQLLQPDCKTIFVRNRIKEINQYRSHAEFRHVPAELNPADIASRGSKLTTLKNSSLWWEGPSFLSKSTKMWPKELIIPKTTSQEIKTLNITKNQSIKTESIFQQKLPWKKLIGSTKLIIQYLHKYKKLQQFKVTYHDAAILLIRNQQQIHPPTPKIINKYQLYQDEQQVWRLNTRLRYADLPHSVTQPIWLPTEAEIIQQLVLYYHEICHHQNALTVTTEIRQHYWISYRFVKTIVKRCIRCKIYNAKPYSTPIFAPLPSTRTTIGIPFENTGIDIAGPIKLKNEQAFFIIFTCLKIRAVHLEMLHSTKSEDVINAIKKFIARRGVPKYILSDNATYFIAVRSIIIKWYQHKNEIIWNTTTPHAPWQGGTYERLIGSIKTGIQRTIGKRKLTYQDMEVFILSIEATLNNRPITPLIDDVDHHVALRPIDFLRPKGLENVENNQQLLTDNLDDSDQEFSIKQTKVNELRLLQDKYNQLLNTFWERWQKEYLSTLIEKGNSNSKESENPQIPKVGELIIIEDEERPRSEWKLGRIIQPIKSKDNIVRTCEILLPNQKITRRAISQLYPLEIGGIEGGEKLKLKEKESPQRRQQLARRTKQPNNKTQSNVRTLITTILILFNLITLTQTQKPYLCHGKTTTLWKMSNLTTCHEEIYTSKEIPNPRKIIIYKKNNIEYETEGFRCKLESSTVRQQTLLNGNIDVKEIPNQQKHLNEESCYNMITKRTCQYGTLIKQKNSYQTQNRIEINPPNRIMSFIQGEAISIKHNCILTPTRIFSHFGTERATSALGDISHCDYSKGICRTENNEIFIWKPNEKQKCRYIKAYKGIGLTTSTNVIIKEIHAMMTFDMNNKTKDCGQTLIPTRQGLAIQIMDAEPTVKRHSRKIETENQNNNHLNQIKTTISMNQSIIRNNQPFGLLALQKGATKEEMRLKGYSEKEVNQYLNHMKRLRTKRQLLVSDEETADLQFLEHQTLKSIKQLTHIICNIIQDQNQFLYQLSLINPTAYIKYLLKREDVIARKINNQVLEIEFCHPFKINEYKILPNPDSCEIPIQLNNYKNNIWYLNKFTHQLQKHKTDEQNCSNTTIIGFENKLYEYNRYYGTLVETRRNTISNTSNERFNDWNFLKPENEFIYKDIILHEATTLPEEIISELQRSTEQHTDLLIQDQSVLNHRELKDEILEISSFYKYLKFIWIIWVSIACALETYGALLAILSYSQGKIPINNTTHNSNTIAKYTTEQEEVQFIPRPRRDINNQERSTLVQSILNNI